MDADKVISEFSRIALLDVEELLNKAATLSSDKAVCEHINGALARVNMLRRQVCQVLGGDYD